MAVTWKLQGRTVAAVATLNDGGSQAAPDALCSFNGVATLKTGNCSGGETHAIRPPADLQKPTP